MTDLLIGAHAPAADPLGEAEARGADLAQLFVGNPQSWKKPVPRDDADELRAAGQVCLAVAKPCLLRAPEDADAEASERARDAVDVEQRQTLLLMCKGLQRHAVHIV